MLAGIAAERGEELPTPQGRLAKFFVAAPKPHGDQAVEKTDAAAQTSKAAAS
jgi:hypothetical protein